MNSTVAIVAANFRAVGLTVASLVLIAFVLLFVRNIFKARSELGSEIELAPNKKPYLGDEDLEGIKLDRSLSFALVFIGMLALAIPFYWLAEPGRQAGAEDAYNASFESRGSDLYFEGAQCVSCHVNGGVGGAAPYVLQDGDGQFLANAQWSAPALDDVLLRYSEEEVRYILNFGRPGSPMAAWGTPGGGPLTEQQVDNVIVYLSTLQKQSIDSIDIDEAGTEDPDDPESVEAQEDAEEVAAGVVEEVERSVDDGEFDTVGEAVFNMGLYSGFQAGSLSCARCHTGGWSLGADLQPDVLEAGVAACGGGNPSGIGFNLCDGGTERRFPDDTWKRPDGSWPEFVDGAFVPLTDPDRDDQAYVEAVNGDRVYLNDRGLPVTETVDENGDAEEYLILESGDLAECEFVSNLWQPDSGQAYPFDPDDEVEVDENGAFIEPEELKLADVQGDSPEALTDNRIVADCDVTNMPERTSLAQFNFIYEGAEAGVGYGAGGQSAAGMMPGFGKILPPELIQAVVDYERGL